MEIWERFKFSGSEYHAWQIYQAYELQAKKRGDFRKYLPAKTDPREGKNWKYFAETYENFSQDFMFDPYIFIEAQFRNVAKDKTVFPAQLKTKQAIQRYKEHKEALKLREPTSSTKIIIENLASTFRLLKKWWKQNNLPMDSYAAFFKPAEGELMSEGMLFCIQGMVSKYFMTVSKHFIEEYNKLDSDLRWEIIKPNELKGYKIKLMLDKEAYGFAKDLFNGEIM